MPDFPDKKALVSRVVAVVRRDLETAIAAARSTKEAATHEEAKPENDKDTRAIEASYLAGAQGERVRELERTVLVLESLPLGAVGAGGVVGAGALVTARGAEGELLCLFAPAGGGVQVEHEGARVQVVTPKSPLGRALLGARVGDEVEVELGARVKSYEVLAIA